MPSKSRKQHKLWVAVAKSKKFAKRVHIPQRVANEYLRADKRAGKYQGRH